MILAWTPTSWAEYEYWQKTDKKVIKRINQLIKDIKRTPYEGLGKPEPLKFGLSGYWSRRINKEHRLVYRLQEAGDDSTLLILQCRFHYS